MSEMEHTPEPWVAGTGEYNGVGHYMAVNNDESKAVALTGIIGKEDAEKSKANARRIVACVNACEGLPNELLEGPDYNIKAELDTLDDQIAGRLKAEEEAEIAIKAGKNE